jgi:A/G-specific adenine glycosylase
MGWFSQHGRKTLPWQSDRDPYRIWVSEIMLQQTQVDTVIPYFFKFTDRFPDIETLSNATNDQVMSLWAGLGYYARARNLHKAAKIICSKHQGIFPSNFDDVVALPGIGKSTAGAILAFCFNQRHPILDGNVKRVLARHFAVVGYPGIKAVENKLWSIADAMTPNHRVGNYTQAIMDMGATVCTRSKPLCSECPIVNTCIAHAEDQVMLYPGRKSPSVRKQKAVRMLIIKNDLDEVLLYKRPPTGIWGGLWSLPEIESNEISHQEWARLNLGLEISNGNDLEILNHGFSHYELLIQPILCQAVTTSNRIMDGEPHLWYNSLSETVGVPAAVQRIFDKL